MRLREPRRRLRRSRWPGLGRPSRRVTRRRMSPRTQSQSRRMGWMSRRSQRRSPAAHPPTPSSCRNRHRGRQRRPFSSPGQTSFLPGPPGPPKRPLPSHQPFDLRQHRRHPPARPPHHDPANHTTHDRHHRGHDRPIHPTTTKHPPRAGGGGGPSAAAHLHRACPLHAPRSAPTGVH